MSVIVVGLDPGGAKAFGWAIATGTFDAPHFIASGICTGARTALAEVQRILQAPPAGVGIDAPLFWSAAGDRRADNFVRKSVCRAGGASGTVAHVNSLQGACLVEGMVAADLAHRHWPTSSITEAHPKALLAVSRHANDIGRRPDLRSEGNHIRDAALGALTALAMLEKRAGWLDLSKEEPEPMYPFAIRAEYWFPERHERES